MTRTTTIPTTTSAAARTRAVWARALTTITLAAAVSAGSIGSAAAAPLAPTRPPASGCDVLHVFGWQGTGESGDADATDVDTGFLGTAITIPLRLAADEIGRTLVPYAASFGGKPGDSSDLPYAQSIADGVSTGLDFLSDYAARCPGSPVALTGYSQGAQIASEIARAIGAGDGPIPAKDVAAVALFSDPTRPASSPVFPGSPNPTSPAAPPGVPSTDLAGLTVTAAAADGGGIAPTDTTASASARIGSSSPASGSSSSGSSSTSSSSAFGQLSGRVAQFCTPGDLACSLPAKSTLAQVVTNISGQLHLQEQDPQRTLIDLAGALGGASLRTAADVVNEDVDFTNGRFQVTSGGETVLGRLAENSAPSSDTPEADAKIVRAVVKAGVMGLGAAVTVAKKVLTPATITELATVGLANPPAALASLGAKVGAAVVSLFPPATISSVQRKIYHEITQGIEDNTGLLTLATDVRYWATVRLHGTYDQVPVTDDGQTPAKFTVEWFTRLANALTDDSTEANTGTSTPRSATAPSTTRPGAPTTPAGSPSGSSSTSGTAAPGAPTSQTVPTMAPLTTPPKATGAADSGVQE
ncbi:cutinase family protein [Rhodococcus sp. Eu-32]|uniref:cutinase family protein n=1 Tax=Rhodococcus sp. Eu-32 TaxID=1017319 RepID=UPI000DF2745F|nr:cutinase family protein [Rhodococcus sp. Eu-32]RRQ26159.1 cutinase family protein [Rhodococcus sp. Eu-32]